MNRSTLLTLVLMLGLVAGCGGAAGASAPTATPIPPQATETLSPTATPHSASPTAAPQEQAITDEASLMAALSNAGAKVESGDTIEQPFFPVPGKVIKVNGEDVQVFVFADEAEAKAAAATVPADGTAFTTVMVDWIAPPHFYQKGKVIVLYVGTDAATLQLLTTLLGPQFAGG